jgi:hypothetical protein
MEWNEPEIYHRQNPARNFATRRQRKGSTRKMIRIHFQLRTLSTPETKIINIVNDKTNVINILSQFCFCNNDMFQPTVEKYALYNTSIFLFLARSSSFSKQARFRSWNRKVNSLNKGQLMITLQISLDIFHKHMF